MAAKGKIEFLTVRDLKEILKQFPDEAKIILSSDEEGNSYSPMWRNVYVDKDAKGKITHVTFSPSGVELDMDNLDERSTGY